MRVGEVRGCLLRVSAPGGESVSSFNLSPWSSWSWSSLSSVIIVIIITITICFLTVTTIYENHWWLLRLMVTNTCENHLWLLRVVKTINGYWYWWLLILVKTICENHLWLLRVVKTIDGYWDWWLLYIYFRFNWKTRNLLSGCRGINAGVISNIFKHFELCCVVNIVEH